ncbi:Thioredoxin [Oryctes borbonicus]|uniref:Thioredoxin n=1 Tax=Oryctes borbonicus TaxID=1629725 RepID=A0A0T6B7U3_9SCAR|nr:Thioredoxin [Oryctes borbonicus]
MPIFDEAADKVAQVFPEAGRVVMAKVDCDRESSVATRFHITKYPTLKLIRSGQPAKREYRGQRSLEAFETFIKNQLEDPIKEFKGLAELTTLETNKRIIIGYFDSKDQAQYNMFRRVAMTLKDDCTFYAGFGEVSKQMHPPGEAIIVFRPDLKRSNDLDETFEGNINNFDELHIWMSEKCVPLVREITFENAEELTEEGLPFLILFHHPDDTESIKKYNDVVVKELISEKQNINFLTADGRKFAHPLHHLGKSESDLPLIAIDSFKHMYMFPNVKDMEVPGKMKQFIQDLYSGKLHREFHYGPDEETETQPKSTEPEKKPTTPPESTFKKLAPSKNRYTLIKEEL